MLNFFSKRHNRVEVQGGIIFINNQRNNVGKEFEQELVFSMGTSTPEIIVHENDTIVRSFRIEPLLSFTLQHFHAGFSEIQYFYSTNSKETLLIPYKSIENLPVQLQQGIDSSELEILESKLPRPSSNDGVFRYYNSFKCPSCLTPFIDFEKYKEIRTQEYYGNVHINEKPRHLKDNDLVT